MDRYDVLAGYLEPLIEEFTAIYDNVTIEIISLPTDGDKKYSRIWEEKRREMIPEIYSEMNAGAGPDLFLLPGGHFLEDSLFPDVNIAMRQGCFSDLNEYYLTDDELNRDDLVDEVMDFGVVGDARYLLPMTYSYQVAYVDMERLYEAGLDSSIFDSGVMSLLDAVCRLGNSNVADSSRGAGRGNLLTIFPNALDYDTGDVLLSTEELTEFLELVQEHTALWGDEFAGVGSFERYCSGTHWWQQGFV